jgi:hypothetical protein
MNRDARRLPPDPAIPGLRRVYYAPVAMAACVLASETLAPGTFAASELLFAESVAPRDAGTWAKAIVVAVWSPRAAGAVALAEAHRDAARPLTHGTVDGLAVAPIWVALVEHAHPGPEPLSWAAVDRDRRAYLAAFRGDRLVALVAPLRPVEAA